MAIFIGAGEAMPRLTACPRTLPSPLLSHWLAGAAIALNGMGKVFVAFSFIN